MPLPMKRSKIKSPMFEAEGMQRSSKASDFCVGCLPNVFSALFEGANVQTHFICLPSFCIFMVS